MNFSKNQRLAITKAIIKLFDLGAQSLFRESRFGGNRFDDAAMVFYKRNGQALPSHYNTPVCVTAYIHDIELRRALIDLGSSLNIMLLTTSNDGNASRQSH